MSTLETSIVITFVMLVLCGLIILPARLCADTVTDCRLAIEDVDEPDSDTMSAERLNTFLTGISENYRIIYGSIAEEVSEDE